MYPYLKTEDEEEEFNDILDIAWQLFSKRKAKSEIAEKELLKQGVKSVRPLICTIELALWDRDMSDWEIDDRADDVSEIILKVGKDALPDLEDFASNGSCNIFVNEWAQEMIFKVLGLEGKERQKICPHNMKLLLVRNNKKVWVCTSCDAEFSETKNNTDAGKKNKETEGGGI